MPPKVKFIVEAVDGASVVLDGVTGAVAALGKAAFDVAGKALGALTDYTVDAIGAASDLNETYNKVSTVFGAADKTVLAFAENAATALGQSQQAALDAASTFGVFGKAAGLSGEDLAGFSMDLTGLASDLASFYNATPEETVLALGAALRGESEPMRKFGVLLDDATLRAKALELGLISNVKNALTPQQKVLAANAVIMEQTAVAQGDFAKTSKGLANAQRIIDASLKNLSATWGTAFLPIVEKGAGFVADSLIPALTGIADAVAPLIGTVGEALGKFFDRLSSGASLSWAFNALGNELRGAFGDDVAGFVQNLGGTIQGVYEWINGTLMPFVTGELVPWFQTNIPIALQFLSDTWTNTLVPAMQYAWDWIQTTLMPLLVSLWDYLQAVIPPALQFLSTVWTETLLPAIQAVWGWLSDTFIPFLSGTVLPWLSENVPVAIQTLSDFWTKTLQPAMEDVWTWISTILIPYLRDTVYPWLAENVPKALQTLSDFWTKTLQPAMKDVYDFITTSVIPGLKSLGGGADLLVRTSLTSFSNFMDNTIKPGLGGWAWAMTEVVMPGLDSLGGGIQLLLDGALAALGRAIDGINSALSGLKLFIDAVAKALRSLDDKLPPWLRPGSPTPFEIGVRGINKELGEASKKVGNLASEFAEIGSSSADRKIVEMFAALGIVENHANDIVKNAMDGIGLPGGRGGPTEGIGLPGGRGGPSEGIGLPIGRGGPTEGIGLPGVITDRTRPITTTRPKQGDSSASTVRAINNMSDRLAKILGSIDGKIGADDYGVKKARSGAF